MASASCFEIASEKIHVSFFRVLHNHGHLIIHHSWVSKTLGTHIVKGNKSFSYSSNISWSWISVLLNSDIWISMFLCRWSGRNNRGKIANQVEFEEELDLAEFLHPELEGTSAQYKLSSVVMHHGRGFGSGHYTAFCWNHEAGKDPFLLYILYRH
jgi:hypothetical protein